MHHENRDKSRAAVPRKISDIPLLQIREGVVTHMQSVGCLSCDSQYTLKEVQQGQHGWHSPKHIPNDSMPVRPI